MQKEIVVAFLSTIGMIISSAMQSSNGSIAGIIVPMACGVIVIAVLGLIFWKSFKNDPISNIPFTRHAVFVKIEEWRVWVIKGFTLRNVTKRLIFQDLLFNVLKIYENNIRDFVNKFSEVTDPTELRTGLTRYCNDIVIMIGQYYNLNESNYSEEDKQTLSIVTKKFLNWHVKRMEYFKKNATEVLVDVNFFKDNKVKLAVILSLFESLIADMLRDAKSTLDELNGEIARLTFRNRIVGQ